MGSNFANSLTLQTQGDTIEVSGNKIAAPGLPSFYKVGGGSLAGAASGGGAVGTLVEEVPIGAYDGVNTVFTTSRLPSPQIIFLVVNGALQSRFPSRDGSFASQYSLTGQTITFAVAPKPSDDVWVFYFAKSGSSSSGGVKSGKARQFGVPGGFIAGAPAGIASATGTFKPTTATLTFSGAAATPGDTLTIGSTTYTFVSSINNSVANQIACVPSIPAGPVQLHVSVAILNAILSGGDGINVSTPTVANPDVTGVATGVPSTVAVGTTAIAVTAIPLAPDNPITLATTSGIMSWSASSISNGSMSPGDTITIGSQTYTFVTTLNNSIANQVLANPIVTASRSGTSIVTVATMFRNAVSGLRGSGLWYSSATAANASATATPSLPSPNVITVTAKTGGSAGNSIALATTSSVFSWSGSTLGGGSGSGPSDYSGAVGTGTADTVNWGNSQAYNLIGDVSIGVWVKFPSNANQYGTTGYSTIIQRGANAGSGPAVLIAYRVEVAGSSGAWNIRWKHGTTGATGSEFAYTFTANIPDDTWVYVGCTRDSVAKTVTCWIAFEGDTSLTLLGTTSYSTNPVAGSGTDPTNILCLALTAGSGTGMFAPSDHWFIGWIEEHYIWSRTLSAAEHLAAMQDNPSLDAMVLGCFMGDTPEVDMSGNGGSATITGTTIVQGHS